MQTRQFCLFNINQIRCNIFICQCIPFFLTPMNHWLWSKFPMNMIVNRDSIEPYCTSLWQNLYFCLALLVLSASLLIVFNSRQIFAIKANKLLIQILKITWTLLNGPCKVLKGKEGKVATRVASLFKHSKSTAEPTPTYNFLRWEKSCDTIGLVCVFFSKV